MSRRALLIATSRYAAPQIPTLRARAADAQGLRVVLADPGIGGFEVNVYLDATVEQCRDRISDLFLEAKADDLLLLYLSGYGLYDQAGRLYFAAADTRLDELKMTGVPVTFLQEAAQAGRSRRVLMIFDTCFSGTVARGFKPDGHSSTGAGEYFRDSAGVVVMSASAALPDAGEEAAGDAAGRPSTFTRHLIEGLKSGEADQDGDGEVTTEDLHRYVLNKVRAGTQPPQRGVFDLEGDIVVAANPHPRPAQLPEELLEMIAHRRPEMRQWAVFELGERARSKPVTMAMAAQEALTRLTADPNRVVRRRAQAALSEAAAAPPVSPDGHARWPAQPGGGGSGYGAPRDDRGTSRWGARFWAIAAAVAGIAGVIYLVLGMHGFALPAFGWPPPDASSSATSSSPVLPPQAPGSAR